MTRASGAPSTRSGRSTSSTRRWRARASPPAPRRGTVSRSGNSSSSANTAATIAARNWGASRVRRSSRWGATTGSARWTRRRRSTAWSRTPRWPSSRPAATPRTSRSGKRSCARSALLSGPAHRLERLVDPPERGQRHEALVALPRHVHLLREIEEDVRRVLHEGLREVAVELLALGHHGGAARLLEQLVHARVLVVREVAALPLARVPDGVRERVGIVVVRPVHHDTLELRGEQLLHEGRPVEGIEPGVDADALEVLLHDHRGVLHRLVGHVVADRERERPAVL